MGGVQVDVRPAVAPLDDAGVAAAPPGGFVLEQGEPPPRRRWPWVLGVVVGIIAIAVAGVLVWSPWLESPPGPPESVRIDTVDATSVELRWDPPDGGPYGGSSADSYVVLDGEAEVGTVDAPATSLRVDGLTPNTRYELAVVTVVGDRRSEPSATVAVTTDPGTPADLRVGDRNATSVQLLWDAPAGPSVDSYVILHDGDEVGVVAHPETSFVIEDLTPGASYDFEVVARVGSRRSTPATTGATAAAPSPRALAADPAGITTDTIVVTWSAPPQVPAPVEYQVIRNGETVATVPGDTLSYTDTGLAPVTAYEYRVAADWGHEPSAPTDVLVVTTAEPPISESRLAGSWSVDIAVVDDPGDNFEPGTTWTSTWDIEPGCAEGPCDVTLVGDFSPPGFNYRDFTVDLTRDGASYVGSTTAQITHCGDVAQDNTVTVRLTVDGAGADDGDWLADTWTGTIEIFAPYVEVGQSYCPEQTHSAALTATS